ncbi:hypothetical protein [Defluviimonas sp. SAOS-178_SWC]|uniref:hypothetical protein n=1 Tax=Defluviimonas sp. SAOS-178_SWC TaxID=3121287 RepID=UPI00322144AC
MTIPSPVERLKEAVRAIEAEIDADLEESRARLRYRIERGRITFDREVLARHRALRVKLGAFLAAARPMVILTAPVIYALIIPFALLDLFVSVYQAICFPVYGIAKVRRADHIAIDRQHLAYLNGLQKLNCIYCGYCNGLISFVREVAGRTEQYWCPIKHARRMAGRHDHYGNFVAYGDAEAYRDESEGLRKRLGKE